MATREKSQAGGRQARRHGLGSDHPDRRQPRHLHEDRLRQPRGRRVQEHVVAVPRLQRVHEGQGPARRPLHHQPHLRHLRRQPRHLLGATRRTWPTASRRRRSPSGSSTSARRPSTCSTTPSSRTTWCSSTSASRWSRRRTRACSAKAEKTEAPHANVHGYRTIADIMRSYNPFTGETYKEALHMSRITREMFCLMEGRHVHPSTLYPGGVGTVATPKLFTDYLSRLLRCLDFIKKAVAMNDDVFDFFYEALPGYEEVGRRRILLGCWGAFKNPDDVDYGYRTWTTGATRCSSPRASSSTASWSPRTSSTSTSACGSCSAAPTTRTGPTRRRSSTTTRSATRSTSATRGTRRRSPSRRSATSTAATTAG